MEEKRKTIGEYDTVWLEEERHALAIIRAISESGETENPVSYGAERHMERHLSPPGPGGSGHRSGGGDCRLSGSPADTYRGL